MQTTQRHGRPAFSLMELLAVITIIVILASIVIGGMGFVTEKQAKEKVRIQIALMSKAIEEYKLDTGSYPATENTANANGENASKILFKALYLDSDNNGEFAPDGSTPGDKDQKIYLPELNPASNKQGWTAGTASITTKITDPWGNEYRYRSAVDSTGNPNSNTQNPDFDLWSIGKDGDTKPGTPADKANRDDIKNF